MKRRTFLKISLPVAVTGRVCAAASEQPTFSFGVIADPQYADVEPRGSRFYRNSLVKMKAAVAELNQHELAFVVTLGDTIDRDFSSFDAILPLYKALKARSTFVLGNHDFDMADEDKGKVLGRLGMKQGYRSETVGDWHFIYLDGTDVSTYRYGKGSSETLAAKKMVEKMREQKCVQAKPWNGALGAKQMTWFAKELDEAKATKKRVIVFNHYPVFPLGDGHNLWNDKQVVELIAKYPNVVAYMNGHNHKGNYGVNEGCHYVNLKGMVETKEMSAFAVVRCYADRIEVDGFESEPDRTCAISAG